MRKSNRQRDDIVNNFSNEVEDLLDDFESDDISDSKPISPKEYSSYRGKPRTNNQQQNTETEEPLQEEVIEDNTRRRPQNRPSRNTRPSNTRNNRPGVTNEAMPQGRPSVPKQKNQGEKKNGILFIIIGLVVVLLAGFFLFGGNKDDNKDANNNNEQQLTEGDEYQSVGEASKDVNNVEQKETEKENTTETPAPPETPGVSMEDTDAINPGLPNTTNGKNKVNAGTISDANEFLVDINGNPIPNNYEVKQIKTETDFVNYEKRRGITGDGIELLWLDAEYKGIPYTIQVPFKIWKELDPKGITVVSMEVLYLEDDSKVISYMSVKENYKELLEKR